MAIKKVWYLDIGKTSGNSGTYVRVEIFHDKDSDFAFDTSNGRVEVVAEDSNGASVYDLTKSQIEKFRIKFVKRSADGFRFDANNDADGTRKELLELRFKGGDVDSVRHKERENILQLGVNIAWWLSNITDGTYGDCPFSYRVYVYDDNTLVKASQTAGISTSTISSLESDYIVSVGHASDLAQAAQIVKPLV